MVKRDRAGGSLASSSGCDDKKVNLQNDDKEEFVDSGDSRGEQHDDAAREATKRLKTDSVATVPMTSSKKAAEGAVGARSSHEVAVVRKTRKGKGKMMHQSQTPPTDVPAAVDSRKPAAHDMVSLPSKVGNNDAPEASGPAAFTSRAVCDHDVDMSKSAARSSAAGNEAGRGNGKSEGFNTEVVFFADADGRWPGEQIQDDTKDGPVDYAKFVEEGRRRKLIMRAISCGFLVGDDGDDDVKDGGDEGSNLSATSEKVDKVNPADDDGPSARYFRVCHPYFLGGAVQRTGRG